MSGSSGPRASEPLDFTDEEIRELAGRRAKPVPAAARLKKLVPTGGTGRLASDVPTPARITRSELAKMRRTHSRADTILQRHSPSGSAEQAVVERKDERFPGPTRTPPNSTG